MRVAGPLEEGVAARAWRNTVRTTGICTDNVGDVRVLPSTESLQRYLAVSLNQPTGNFQPFLIREGESSRFGLVYRHCLADSVSIRMIMREWFLEIFDPVHARVSPFRLARGGYRNVLLCDGSIVRGSLTLLRRHAQHRTVRKVRTYGRLDYPMRVRLTSAPRGLIDQLRRQAHARNATVNDLFLVVLAEVCARFVPTEARRGRRNTGIGTIVDLRSGAAIDSSQTFGLFLGFSTTMCRPGKLRDWRKLIGETAMQARRARRDGLAATILWTAAAEMACRFVPTDQIYHFFRKEVPLSGGLSNVNLNETWVKDYHPSPILEYVRVSPTGPLAPLVFTTTTLGGDLQMAMTYRPAIFSEWTASDMMSFFIQRLEAIANDD